MQRMGRLCGLLICGFLLTAGHVPAALVAYYDFEDGAGTTVADRTGNGHTGAFQNAGGTDWVAGKVGRWALDLSANQWVSTLNSTPTLLNMNGNKPKSVAFWAYTRAFNDGGVFCMGNAATGEMFSLRTLTGAEQWRAQFYGTPDFDVTAYGCTTNWTHFVLVHDGTQGRTYQNGILIGSKNSTLNVTDVRSFEIGRYNGGSYFNGLVDDVRVYDHALSMSEVQALAGATMDAGQRVADAFTLDAAARTSIQGFVMTQTRSDGAITTIEQGESLLTGARTPSDPGGLGNSGTVALVNHGPGTHGNFGSDLPWVGGDNFAVKVWGVLDIPAPGAYSFAAYTDDGFRFRLGRSGAQVALFPTGRNGRSVWSTYFDEAGLYPFSTTFFENSGGEGLELQYWAGSDPAGTPILLNNTGGGSIYVYQNVLAAADRLAVSPASVGSKGFLSARHVATNVANAVQSLYDVDRLLSGVVKPQIERRQAPALISVADGAIQGMPADYFGGEFRGAFNIPSAGVYTFTCNSDDGFRLEIGAHATVIQTANFPKGGSDISAKAAFLDAGLYPFRLVWFEKNGGSACRLTVDGRDLNDVAQTVAVYPVAGSRVTRGSGLQRFRVATVDTDTTIGSTYDAWQLLRGAIAATASNLTDATVVNLHDGGGGGNGHYGSDAPFAVATPSANDDFVVHAYGYVDFPAAGFWTFGVNSDDGFLLELGGRAVMEYPGARGPGDVLASVYIPDAGTYRLDFTYFERDGGAETELFAAQGLHAAWTLADFDLVGDTANGGLAVYEPQAGTLFRVR